MSVSARSTLTFRTGPTYSPPAYGYRPSYAPAYRPKESACSAFQPQHSYYGHRAEAETGSRAGGGTMQAMFRREFRSTTGHQNHHAALTRMVPEIPPPRRKRPRFYFLSPKSARSKIWRTSITSPGSAGQRCVHFRTSSSESASTIPHRSRPALRQASMNEAVGPHDSGLLLGRTRRGHLWPPDAGPFSEMILRAAFPFPR